jgi:outer membrane protein assembly factor BamE (lipoprotein component of BamABCDE complex)
MFCVSLRLCPGRVIKSCLLVVCAVAFLSVPVARSFAQKPGADTPQFSDFKGVRIGMLTEEVRKKLGSPRDKGDEQDFYVFNDTQAVQIFYDKAKTVTAISIDFMSGANQIPAAKDVVGDLEAKSDGSAYKLVRYPKAGYWVSYSRTAGKDPTTTITMQKIDR